MQLLIGGDLVPTKSNVNLFQQGDIASLLGEELLSLWNSADLRIFNLEVPLADQEDPIPKCGPNFIAPTSTALGIKALNPTLLTLANNHILDQGYQGLFSTSTILKHNQIPYVGAGNNVKEAGKPFIIDKDGLKIGIYACTEHEFSTASQRTPGANPFDPLDTPDHIYRLKEECDYVIVLYHGGKEHYRYPSPYLQKVCHKLVEKGADLILCQHSHCIGCHEEYKYSTIVYGQGNFLFDDSESIYWKTSLLIKLKIDRESHHIEYIPIIKKGAFVRLASEKAADEIILSFNKRSRRLLQEGFIEGQYLRFAQKYQYSYLSSLSGNGKWISRVDRYLLNQLLIKRKYNTKKRLAIQNFMECESHRELVIAGLKTRRPD